MQILRLVQIAGLLLCSVFISPLNAQSWWSCDWPFRTEITVTSDRNVFDRVVTLKLNDNDFNSAYAFTQNGEDIRILDSDDNTPLNFHILEWNVLARSARIDVFFERILPANGKGTLYLYYGNVTDSGGNAVPSQSSAPDTYPEAGWRYHTRNSTLNPSSEAEARTGFDNARDRGRYGCAVVPEVLGRNNWNTFNGAATNYGLYAETYFEVTTPGLWQFRAGIDFGRGGDFFVNGEAATSRWNENLWWAYNYNNSDTLTGSFNLDSGYHHFEILGYEGCCDGTISVQYLSPGSTTWQELGTDNLNVLNAGCPSGSQWYENIENQLPLLLSGITFLDNGNNGIPHNGLAEGDESGLDGLTVTAEFTSTNELLTTSTDSSGEWKVCTNDSTLSGDLVISTPVPNAHYAVSERSSVNNTDTPLNATIQFPVQPGTHYSDINLGFISQPALIHDNEIEISANATKLFAHRYSPSSSGEISIQLSQQAHTPANAFSYEMYRDTDCDGALDSTEFIVQSPIAVEYGADVCMLIKIESSSSVSAASILSLQLDVATQFTGIAVAHTNTNIDKLRGVDESGLVLSKSVCNVADSTCNVISGEGFTETTSGKPEDELVYRLEFEPTANTVHDVTVFDTVPAFTRLKPFSVQVVTVPAGMNCTIVHPLDQSTTYFTGNLQWTCDGQATVSESGVVAFSVVID